MGRNGFGVAVYFHFWVFNANFQSEIYDFSHIFGTNEFLVLF